MISLDWHENRGDSKSRPTMVFSRQKVLHWNMWCEASASLGYERDIL